MAEPDFTPLKELLKKQVTRKEFLQIVGLAVLTTLGVGKLLGNSSTSTTAQGGDNIDYGVDEYGG